MRFALSALLCAPMWIGCDAVSAAPSPPSTPTTTCPAALSTVKSGTNTLTVSGQSRSFYAILPEGSTQGAPLFIAFNGTSENGEGFARRARLDQLAARGFVVFAPSSNGNGQFWPVWDALRPRGEENGANADLDLFDTLHDCARTRLGIDTSRVYIGGHSAGGIFTNYVLQRRSSQLAGAIVASGVYSQTSPAPAVPLDPLVVIVTWGGPNDAWTGRAGGSAVKDFGFVSEASVASTAYSRQPGVGVVTCEGASLGHAWLDEINGWMADVLLAHPKGGPPLSTLPPLPTGAPARCALGPWQDAPVTRQMCPTSAVAGCQDACQQIADGAVANRTVGPVLKSELRQLGFSATGACSGCITNCEKLAVEAQDAAVLACMAGMPDADPAVGGIAGTQPLIDAVNQCCRDQDQSGWCRTVCKEMRGSLAARAYFDGCPR